MNRRSAHRFQRTFLAAAALFSAGAVLLAPSAHAQSWAKCVEAIAHTQHDLKQLGQGPAHPATQGQSVAAQDSHQPTASSVAAAGLSAPETGAAGALNEALNLQAAGDEAGCMKAVTKARSLAGLK